jgi:hypothetical protein
LTLEERYIQGPLADSITRQDVHIHDEWKAFRGFGVRPRRVHSLRKRNQSIHPFASFLQGQPVYFKATETTHAYAPLCRLPEGTAALPATKFRKDSFLKDLAGSLRDKFPRAEFDLGT